MTWNRLNFGRRKGTTPNQRIAPSFHIIYIKTMILFENVTKKYGKTKVLDKINLTIQNGEFITLIGHSGAGKSTLVYSLIGAEPIAEGSIKVDGYEVNKMSGKALQYFRRKIGIVFQDYKLLKNKNVFENTAFALEVCGCNKKEIKNRTREVLSIVGLGKKQKKFPHQLSGGEKQRTAIARALVHNPNLIVADEPTGNLDPKTAEEIIKLLMKINEDGTTVMLATHNIALVDLIKQRVVTLEEGKIVKDKKSSGYHN
jgi:cell division transport system ATP-binding protein